MIAATLFDLSRTVTAAGPQVSGLGRVAGILWRLLPLEFAILAALILARQPRNAIGWLLLVTALSEIPTAFSNAYGLASLVAPPASPSLGLMLALWFNTWDWTLLMFPILLIPLLYPTGRPPSPRWRWVIVFAAAMWTYFLLITSFSSAFSNTAQGASWSVPNPIGFISHDWLSANVFFATWISGLIILTLLCAAALFVRFRRAAGAEREQIKWLLFAIGVFALIYVIGVPLSVGQQNPAADTWSLLFVVSVLFIPLAIAVAIRRYHLWDIDLIINRALVYVPLTAILAGIFAGASSVTQKTLVAATGQNSVASTLVATIVVVAIFDPVKDRVKKVVDRRFKETPSPSVRLNAFEERVRGRVSELEVGPAAWRFLDEAVSAFDAEAGAAYLSENGAHRQIHAVGDWKGVGAINVAVESGGERVASVALGPRRHGRVYGEADRMLLQQAAQSIGQAIEEDRRIRRALAGPAV